MPISLALKGGKCLVIGGGKVALRKIDSLLDYSIEITVIAPQVESKIQFYAEKGMVLLAKREYRSPEAANYRLVISASDNPDLNRQVCEDCRQSAALVNVVDNPPLCDFIFPALVKRDRLTVAVSTDGQAPFLAGHLRIILENVFPEHWSKLIGHAGEFRKMVRRRWPEQPEKRAECYERFVSADWRDLLKTASEEEIGRILEEMLER
jgi:siroheme synthase-like protein